MALRLEGRAFYKNGFPHTLIGVNYSPTPIGYSASQADVYDWTTNIAQTIQDLEDMASAGINCIKVYMNSYNATNYATAMATCTSLGIDIIALTFCTYNLDYSLTTGTTNRAAAITRFISLIQNLSGYPAVVGYGFGNENNFNLATTTAGDWYQLVNDACVAGKAIDSTRFYYTANGEVSTIPQFNAAVPALDVWGANVYRGTSFGNIYSFIQTATRKPFIITEFGINRYDTVALTEQEGVQANSELLQVIELSHNFPLVAGFVLFKYSDAWTSGNPNMQDVAGDYWGMSVALPDNSNQVRPKKKAFKAIDTFFTGKTFLVSASGDYLIDQLGNSLVTKQ
jgi:hypothetical protein